MTPKSGRRIAWTSFVLGILVSIAGNIGHAASDGMKPGEWAGAAFWPTALMLSIEILTRVRWQPEKRWTVARIAGLLAVALVAAVLSYRHLAGLLTYWGEDPLNAYLGPLAVDGLMLISAAALLSISKESSVEQINAPATTAVAQVVQLHDDANGIGYDAKPVESQKDTTIAALLDDILPPADKPKVSTSKSVPPSAAVEHATQIWLNSDPKPSVRKLAELSGLSASKSHRLISDLKAATP
mgnify:CR=1 FL=1